MCKKRIIIVGLLAITMLTSMAAADAMQRVRHVEFSIAGSAQAFTREGEKTSLMMNMPLRVGAFVTRDFEIEAEGITTIIEVYNEFEVGYIASLNGSFNFPSGNPVLPFLLVGIGFTNGTPLGNVIAGKDYDVSTLTVLNLGFGAKILLSHMAALRLEYRFQKFSGNEERWRDVYDGYNYHMETYTRDYGFNLHSVFMGVSLFI